jgi:hypothetical protein
VLGDVTRERVEKLGSNRWKRSQMGVMTVEMPTIWFQR